MIKPEYPEAKALAAGGEYRTLPISMELYSDFTTPIEVLRKLKRVSSHCFLLESIEDSQKWGRYTFLGYDPKLELTCKDGTVVIQNGTKQEMRTEHPGEYIRKVIHDNKSPRLEGLPTFTGGLVGYFSYDYIKYAEPSLVLDAEDTEGFQDVDLMLFDKVIAFDNFRQKLILIAHASCEDIESDYSRAVQELEGMRRLIESGDSTEAGEKEGQELEEKRHLIEHVGSTEAGEKEAQELEGRRHLVESGRSPAEESGKLTTEFSALFDEAGYCKMVERAKEYIREGDIFQVVLSNRLEAGFEGSLLDTYRVLRTTNPSPYMFYFSSEDIEIAGASPETLVKVEDGVAHTFPLAGTRPRGATPKEDQRLEHELLADEKERAEHNMLVDLGRNDIGKISKFGSVEVEKYMSIERFSHVMHIGSTVKGILREDADAVDAVDAILPAGTLSGAPKIRACEIINELEDNKRGIYGGAIGYMDFTGNLDTCIAIRIAYKKNGKVFIRSGAGIVADSIPKKEYQECINKAKAVRQALEASQGGL